MFVIGDLQQDAARRMANTSSTSTRLTAAERREHLLEVAMHEFAQRGFEGGSTERIAAAAGISQPYVFRLFGSKHNLFVAVLERCFADTFAMFERCGEGLTGQELLTAIGDGYTQMILSQPARLQAQLAGYAACDDEAVRECVRGNYGRLVSFIEQRSGFGPERIATFFAKGMLLNVLTAMQLTEAPLDWGDRLIVGCRQPSADTD
jgi:AcrR family transcriptional regulator